VKHSGIRSQVRNQLLSPECFTPTNLSVSRRSVAGRKPSHKSPNRRSHKSPKRRSRDRIHHQQHRKKGQGSAVSLPKTKPLNCLKINNKIRTQHCRVLILLGYSIAVSPCIPSISRSELLPFRTRTIQNYRKLPN
jgi:hypothetical protein